MLDELVESYKPSLIERLCPLLLIAFAVYMIMRKS